jgi:hypothetical protein
MATLIGISSGLITILVIALLKQFDKKALYGLMLAGIGFLYVGFVWTDSKSVVGNSIQAIVFLFLAYYGIKKNILILATGYFLHGCWDLAYGFISNPALIPPHYDLFCSSLDFIIGAYILLFRNQFQTKKSIS